MSAFDCYKDYVALKLHFRKWDYDFFLFKGQTHATVKAFEKRKDQIWFEKLANLHSPFERILANVIRNENSFIRDIVVYPEVYLDWQGRQDTLTITFQNEIANLRQVFNSNFLFTPGSHPYLVREYLGGRISLETLTIISDLTDCVSYWEAHLDDDALFELTIRRIMKYSPFLEYDMEKFRKILIERVEE